MWKHQDVFVKFSISWYSLKPPEMKKCYFLQEISEAINFYSLPLSHYLNAEWEKSSITALWRLPAAKVMLSSACFSECCLLHFLCPLPSRAEAMLPGLPPLLDIPCGFIDTLVKRHTSLEESCSLHRLSCVCA